MDSVLLQVENLSVNIQGKEILKDISLDIRRGEQWVILGAAGSGKTILAHTLAGHHAFHGKIKYAGPGETIPAKALLVVDHQHRFRDVRNQTNFYYQQRYNAFDAEATITVEEDLAVFEHTAYTHFSIPELLDTFHLAPLLHEPLICLSNGENKRLQILKAILSHPPILVLDEPFTGLDVAGRILLDGILKTLSESGQQFLLLSSRNYIPGFFNRFAILEKRTLSFKKHPEEMVISPAILKKPSEIKFPTALSHAYPEFRFAVRMRDVRIRYGEKNVLEGINWDIVKGSFWSLTGPNGSGKSTLLSLITGDHPQAYSNEIYLFDRKRGSGESIWDIKQKIGYMSPELNLYFDPSATVFTALASGLFDTIGLFRSLTPLQEKCVMEWLGFLDCENDAHRLLNSLSAGLQRMVLLGRAMIKMPPLLVLDEPCQGLDTGQIAKTLDLIDRYCLTYGSTLIFVSHYASDFPSCIGDQLRLEMGKRL
jgi:molybdate transport system ATP-binding protein